MIPSSHNYRFITMPDLIKHITDLEAVLTRTQARLSSSLLANRDLKLAAAVETRLRERCDEELATLSAAHAALQAQNQAMKTELELHRGTLSDLGTSPNFEAQYFRMRDSCEALTAQRDTLQKSLDSSRADFDFTRQQYQLASGAAAESARRVQELEAENLILSARAEARGKEFREMAEERQLGQLKGKITALEAGCRTREWEARVWAERVVRLDDEIRGLKHDLAQRPERGFGGAGSGFAQEERYEFARAPDGEVYLRMIGGKRGGSSGSEAEGWEDESEGEGEEADVDVDEEDGGEAVEGEGKDGSPAVRLTREGTTNPIQQSTEDLGL